MTLVDKFKAALQEATNVAPNKYLTFLYEALRSVETASLSNPVLVQYVNTMHEIVSRSNFALSADNTNEFSQLLGEAHFSLLCAERKISLERVPQGRHKTPDFHYHTNQIDLYFEVKTLSVVDGSFGINRHLDNTLNDQIELERQMNTGKRVAIVSSVMQPYGNKPYINGTIFAVIKTLIEKISQNIKTGQFSNPLTFLVVNLSMLPPFCTDNRALRPIYCDNFMFNKCITGELWMMAFGQPGMLIHGNPGFEGKPSIEGIINKCGILADDNYADISGLFFMVHPWRRDPEIWGAFRSENYFQWEDSNPDLISALLSLTGNNWNDDKDSNGWQLQGLITNN